MLLKDRILNFQRFALTNHTSVYNEDGMTAQQLAIASANKIKECLLAVDDLAEAIRNIENFLKIEYSEQTEDLTFGEKVDEIKKQVNASYVCIFDENAMTTLELAGNTAKAVNECLKAVNMLCDLVLEVNAFVGLHYEPGTENLTVGGGYNGGN